MSRLKVTWRQRNGIWYARLKHPRTGEWIERATGATSKRLAEKWVEAHWNQLVDPDSVPLSALPLGATVEAYIEARRQAVAAAGNRVGEVEALHSRRKKLSQVTERLGAQTSMTELTRPQIIAWREARLLEVSGSTVHKELNELRQVFRWCLEREEVRLDPTDGVKVEVEHKKVDRSLTPEQAGALIRAAPAARQVYLQLLFETGCRPGREVESIRWGGVNFSRALVHIPGTKTKDADRHVPVRRSFLAVLSEFREGAAEDTAVLKPWGNIRRDLDLLCEKAGLPHVRPYDLRHCYASWALQGGAPEAHVARALGHANTTMLHRTYGHLRPEHLVEVVEALPDLHIGPERAQEGTLAQPVPKKSAQVASKYDENSKNKNPGEACNLPGLLSFPLCPDPELNQGHGDFQSVNFKKWQQPATRDNNDFR